MAILLWIVFGIVAGSVAKLAMPGPDQLGLVGTMLVGAVGAVAGGLLGAAFVASGVNAFDIRGFLLAMIGSMALLFGYRSYSMRAMA